MTLLSVVSGSSKTVTLPNIAGYVPIMTNSPGTTAISATITELNYVDGVTSNIQTQLNGKASTSHTHVLASGATDVTATAAEVNVLDGITATTAELNYTSGVTSAIQTQLNAKAPLASPALTGTPTAPSAAASTDSTQIATTAFVQDAIDARTYVTSVGGATSIAVTHNLGTKDVIVQLYDNTTFDTVLADVNRNSTSQVTLTFASAPSAGNIRVLVSKII